MPTTLERLRRLQELRRQRKHTEPENHPFPTVLGAAVDSGVATRLEEVVGGEALENSGGVCYLRTHTYGLHELRGQYPLGNLLAWQPTTLAPFHPNFSLHKAADFAKAAFIDTETTGLGNGAGVYCFMVGVGTFERLESDEPAPTLPPHPAAPSPPLSPTHFVVRQFFMRNPAEEAALLIALAELLARHDIAVTFNGRTFDLPLLRARFRQNDRVLPLNYRRVPLLDDDQPHLDLLHPARRLWRRRLQSCRLLNLEQQVLGWQRRDDDVPGHLIPSLYVEYVRSGNAQQIGRIFYHNCEDIVSMVALAERLNRHFGQPLTEQYDNGLRGLDWLALGQCYEDLERWEVAEQTYRRALGQLDNHQDRAEVFNRLGQMMKRQERWHEAAELWQHWLTSVPGNDPTPYVELAKYCEWQLNDLEQAEMWTAWALHTVRAGQQRSPGIIGELEHRLTRVRRKM